MKLINPNEGNIIFKSLKEAETTVNNVKVVPPGYIEVRLSTRGKVGAPEVIHVRNFKVRDIIALSLSSDVDITERLALILNDMILEDTDVNNWHEKEVTELMVYILKTFYKDTLDDIDFPYTEKDLEELKNANEENYKAVIEKKWTPKTSFTVSRDVSLYEVPDNFTAKITITNKKTNFYCTFDYIKYGDQLIIKNWLDSYFAEDAARFKNIESQILRNNNILKQFREDPDIVNKLIPYNPEEEKAYEDYRTRRLQALGEMVRIISITDYNGMDVSDMSASDKYELMKNDARIDYGMINKLNKRQQKLQFGIMPGVSMRNPFNGEVVKRPFSFRLSTLIQAMQLSGDDDYDDGYDDED